MDFTRFLAGSAVLGLIAGFWGRIKTVVWKFFNLFVQQVELLDENTATVVIGYLIGNHRRSQLYDKTYGAYYDHTTDGKYGLISFELFGKRDIIFWNGWVPFLFTTGKGDASTGNTGGQNHNNQDRGSPGKITFIRGSVDVEGIVKAACEARNTAAWSNDHVSRKKIRRFFIRHVPAISASKTYSEDSSAAALAWYQQGQFRLLQHSIDQLGKRRMARTSPLEDLIFPQRVKDLIREVLLWRGSKEWYQERGIPWKRGWLCYGPPGTGKTALARAFAEELDMPIFVYNLAEITNHELMRAWTKMQASVPCIALIEDIDNVFHGRENVSRKGLSTLLLPRKKKQKNNNNNNNNEDDESDEARGLSMLSFDVLLNCLDGVERSDGVFTIITTNDIRKVDPALGQPRTLPDGTFEFISTRPGRIDKAVELTYMEPEDKKRMARRILGLYEDEYLEMLDFIERYPDLQETPAQFQERCAQIALRCFWGNQHVNGTRREAVELERV
jgi:hypothetical protein